MWYKATGKLRASKDWLVIDASNTITRYYAWWVQKFVWKKVSTPLHGAHITVVAGKYENLPPNYGKGFNGEVVEFEYSNIVETNWQNGAQYFWLPVRCPRVRELRLNLGLTPRPKWPLHLTICYLNY